ncbi:MAG: hypothetical protein JNN01_05875 [Opitutaceae bacterium]|nr:hypothetical protein [Opitutaceae bacterium]
MATVTRRLPQRPHLDVPKREARELLDHAREGRPDALERLKQAHPRSSENNAVDSASGPPAYKLCDAQWVIAREYGFSTWAELKQRIRAHTTIGVLQTAIEKGERDTVVALLRAHPELLHLPVWSGNWGPPMSHAANLGLLDIVQAVSALGARDHQHAFDRAVLQGRVDCARWLHAHGGVRLGPGSILGSCETLNVEGFTFLLEIGAPLTNECGDPLAPLALVLETYARSPARKHTLLDRFVQQGHTLPDTPTLALHRGDLPRLRQHLREDPHLLKRRFGLPEIYPESCGCRNEGRSGMHWTPIDGSTLLHLAVDFQEREIFDWLLTELVDVDTPARVDPDGFGGHTALFNAVVNGPLQDPSYAAALLARGANPATRATLRKFLDWCEKPRWHEARQVTPAVWARTFPDAAWVNRAALALLPG